MINTELTLRPAVTELTLSDGSVTELVMSSVIDNRPYYEAAFSDAKDYTDVLINQTNSSVSSVSTGLNNTNTAVSTLSSALSNTNTVIALVSSGLSDTNAEYVVADAATLSTALAATLLVKDLAEVNELKISHLQDDLDTTNQTVTDNFTSLSASKADQSALDTLQTLVDTKATPADITAAIAALVGGAPDALNTLNEIAAALQGDEATIATILSALDNRVRFDASQSLTVPQQDQARSNIYAEKVGVAASLIAAITPGSIGAATSAQGTKADSALQSGDVAPVALSGSYSSLIGKPTLTVDALTNVTITSKATNDLLQWNGTAWVNKAFPAAGIVGNSLMRPTQSKSSASNVLTIDLSQPYEVYTVILTENITSWSFTNLPAAGFTAELRIVFTQSASTAYTVANPISGGVYGGFSPNSSALRSVESWGLVVTSAGIIGLFQSGVKA